jgi:hypothetical protein
MNNQPEAMLNENANIDDIPDFLKMNVAEEVNKARKAAEEQARRIAEAEVV